MTARKRIYHWLSSLRVTVVLLMLTMVLVFVGTIAQVQMGIEPAVAKFFRSWLVSMEIGGWTVPVFPGGFLLGFLLLINLIAAQSRHFRLDWKDAGIWMAHGGVLILLLGEFVIATVQQEWVISLDEGETKQYVEAYRTAELTFIQELGDGTERVVAFSPQQLRSGVEFEIPESDLAFRVIDKWAHADLVHRSEQEPAHPTMWKAGARYTVRPSAPPTAMDRIPHPAAEIEVFSGGESIGRYLVSLLLKPQLVEGAEGWRTGFRLERKYLPFSLTLDEFIHERHAGTDIPSRFSSILTMTEVSDGSSREIEITMNEPMRRDGWTFYQHSFGNNDLTSILHAVKNPAQALPYIACLIGAIGLTWQFTFRLGRFLGKRREPKGEELVAGGKALQAVKDGKSTKGEKRRAMRLDWVVGVAALVPFLFVASGLARTPKWDGLPLGQFLELPVLMDGRLKPLDTVAKSSLLVIHGKSQLRVPTGEPPTFAQQIMGGTPSERVDSGPWLAELLFDFNSAERRPVFRVENAEVLQGLGLTDRSVPANLSFAELDPLLGRLSEEARKASETPSEHRNRYQRDVIKLFSQARLYLSLTPSMLPDPGTVVDVMQTLPTAASAILNDPEGAGNDPDVATLRRRLTQAQAWDSAAGFFPVAPEDVELGREGWITTGKAVEDIVIEGGMTPSLQFLAGIAAAGQVGDADKFAEFTGQYGEWLAENHPVLWKKVRSETMFNRANLFGAAMTAFVLVMVAVGFGWFFKSERARRVGFGLALGAFVAMTIGLGWRMWIEARPPVTNLYSSAVFIAWACAGLALYLERIYKNGLGIFVGALSGFSGLIVAHHLSLAGDTMEMMRAVLDSNFWLATHVVTITLGYAATFVAGFVGAVALIRGVFGREARKEEENMVFGAVCFALLLSFVGTLLGGIWADQSWGRFWGWDPKENGALLIVLWCAVIIHGRLAGWLRRTGTMVTAVFGNAITSWSWFGTNMLGIGLHSYGFMDEAFFWLSAFIVVQVAIMMLGWFQPDQLRKARRIGGKNDDGDGAGRQRKANEPVGAGR